MYPAELDSLSLCYLFNALAWKIDMVADEIDRELRLTSMLCTAVFNWGGMGRKKAKPLGWIYDKLFKKKSRKKSRFDYVRDMSIEEFRDAMKLLRQRGLERRERERVRADGRV